jgi:hypothetical protein
MLLVLPNSIWVLLPLLIKGTGLLMLQFPMSRTTYLNMHYGYLRISFQPNTPMANGPVHRMAEAVRPGLHLGLDQAMIIQLLFDRTSG